MRQRLSSITLALPKVRTRLRENYLSGKKMSETLFQSLAKRSNRKKLKIRSFNGLKSTVRL